MQYKVKATFQEDLLGTVPLNKEIYSDHIATKKEELSGEHLDQELSTVMEKLDEKGKTGFHRLPDGTPIIYDYVIRGFMKDACGMMRRVDKSESSKLKAYKRVIDGLVFVMPRQIEIEVVGEIGTLERPLRAQTAQGERVALAYSESIPAGSSIEFTLMVLDDKAVSAKLIEEWFNYGSLRGLGQWRNASYGRIDCEVTPLA